MVRLSEQLLIVRILGVESNCEYLEFWFCETKRASGRKNLHAIVMLENVAMVAY